MALLGTVEKDVWMQAWRGEDNKTREQMTKDAAYETRGEPKSVFLFSGHMIDAPGRTEPRFPNEEKYVDIAANAIAAKLDELGASKDDFALCGGACGGDLLFAEACLERGIHLEIRIPFEERTFLLKSVSFAGNLWQDRYYKVKRNQNTKLICHA